MIATAVILSSTVHLELTTRLSPEFDRYLTCKGATAAEPSAEDPYHLSAPTFIYDLPCAENQA